MLLQGTLELRLLDITAPAMAPIAQVVIVNAWPQVGWRGELAVTVGPGGYHLFLAKKKHLKKKSQFQSTDALKKFDKIREIFDRFFE